MLAAQRVVPDRYTEVQYSQFNQSLFLRIARGMVGVLCWPIALPLALVSRLSDIVFRTASEMVSLLPFLVGVIFRYEFYRWALQECGKNVMIGFGTVFFYRDIRIGDNVAFGNFNVIHHCDFGSHVLIADSCHFLSGSRYHNFDRTDKPMALQGGMLRKIAVGDDCWIGASAILMDDVGKGAIVGAGSVVTRIVDPFSVVVGNPAKPIRDRRAL